MCLNLPLQLLKWNNYGGNRKSRRGQSSETTWPGPISTSFSPQFWFVLHSSSSFFLLRFLRLLYCLILLPVSFFSFSYMCKLLISFFFFLLTTVTAFLRHFRQPRTWKLLYSENSNIMILKEHNYLFWKNIFKILSISKNLTENQ